ncbi:glycosyl transferase family protein [Sphingomonas bacterium]|uniref:glycosyl transferase family protein n=1 Tax=Sphingomonas bacterium TaxID=1895847 RepID=UPI0015774736|nr:glycosyl transferase family protein [Sphingomonas bacterium]
MDEAIRAIDAVLREITLFAAAGLLIGGIDDLLVDLLFLRHRWFGQGADTALTNLPAPAVRSRFAVFVAAWDEAAVIGQMLATASTTLDHPDFRIFVGLYPNDRGSIDAAARVAEADPRIILVIGEKNGPTTKADCLNTLWRALQRADARTETATTAVVLHDAEDVVHRDELRVFETFIVDHRVVQLPVVPLIKRSSRLVSGHYADEFAENHGKGVIVRRSLGAGMPLAGTGCAIAVPMLATIARMRGGDPFDASSLTEDYELGLRIAELGGRAAFARVRDADDMLVAVRAFFPDRIDAAVRQKARWMTGIALAGWDRTGWARWHRIGDHWMRMRDRRAPLAVIVLGFAYAALLGWGIVGAIHWGWAVRWPMPGGPDWLVEVNLMLLGWRLAMRMAFTGRAYGWREAWWSVPRFVVGNYVALLAARRALTRYVAMLRGAPMVWDKTRHAFPDAHDLRTQ